jgi:predicted alpha/beta hydrolase
VVTALEQLEGYDLMIIGHSMGAGVAALLVQQLTSVPELKARLHGRAVRGVGVATAACMSGWVLQLRHWVCMTMVEHG